MKWIKYLPLLVLLTWAGNLRAEPLITVVALVNNDVVTSYQLEQKMAEMKSATRKSEAPATPEEALRSEVLNLLIEDLLVQQRIALLGLSVSDQELTAAIEDVQRQNKLTLEQLQTALQAQGVSMADYRQNLRKEILRYKLLNQEVRSKVEVTRTQIRDYFEAHRDAFTKPASLHLARLSFPLPASVDDELRQRLMQQAQIARQQLLAGKSVQDVIRDSGGAAEGGDMGVMAETELHPELQKAIEGLTTGEISEPTLALGSLHVCKVIERTPAQAELTDDVSAGIEKILSEQNSEKRFNEWKKELRKGAVIDIRIPVEAT
jgi:peptidyl-prolyl cis-trans isomerase SurA